MKKLILAFILLSISASVVIAAQSKAYYFTAALLQSVYKFDEANALFGKANDMEDKKAAERGMGKAISTMEEAKSIIRPWLADTDTGIQRTANAVDQGLDVFLADSRTAAGFIAKANRGETVNQEEMISYAMEGEEREDRAYLNMGSAIAKYVPEGLSKKERGQLAFRIDLLFGKELKKYRFYPTQVTELTIGISALDSRLKGKDVDNNPYFKMLINGEKPFPEK